MFPINDLESILLEAGYNVTFASNLNEARMKLNEIHFDVVVVNHLLR